MLFIDGSIARYAPEQNIFGEIAKIYGYFAEKHGARMLVVPLAPNTPRHVEILRSIAADLDLPFLDTSALPADASLWLPGDGHFSPAGARRMAEMVAERLRQGE